MKKFIIIILLFGVSCNQKSNSQIGKKINEKNVLRKRELRTMILS